MSREPRCIAFHGAHSDTYQWSSQWIGKLHQRDQDRIDAKNAKPTDNHDPGDEDRS